MVQPDPVTEYDVIRVLPFGGRVTRAAIDGALLEIGAGCRPNKPWAQEASFTRAGRRVTASRGLIAGKPLDVSARYTVAMTDFLMTGGETNLGFLTRTNPAVHAVQDLRDVRLALIDELRAQYATEIDTGTVLFRDL